MAYVEVWKSGRLVTRRRVDEQKARKGCRVRLGSAGEVRVAIGQSETLGELEVRMFAGEPPTAWQEGRETASIPPHDDQSLPPLSVEAPVHRAEQMDRYPDIEGYKIIEPLGEGGMGIVWCAEQLSTRRQVALKLMVSHRIESPKAQARFQREVELTARLDHPNIARIYDSGLHQGMYYYAMELVDGVPLDRYVKSKGLSKNQILALMQKVCQAVLYAHLRAVIHRDLKPSNILVSPDGQPHVLDFGLAKALLQEDDALTISVEGQVAGTPAYMSPEQAAGHHSQTDTRTDVFSLGVILYELLTGQSPHDLSGSMFDVLHQITEGRIRRPREVDKSIDSELEALLRKALALEPDDRYASAGALAKDISNYLDGEPLDAQVPTILYFLRKKASKYRMQIGVAMLAVLILSGAGLFGYMKWTAYRTRPQEIRIEAELRRLAEEKLGRAELELIALGDDKNKARAALRYMRDLHIDALEENTKLKENAWQPPRMVRRAGLSTVEPLSAQSLIKRPAHLPDVQSWTIETSAHRGPIQTLSSDFKGHRMASCGIDGTIRVWDRSRGELECIFVPSASQCSGLAWLADDNYLVSCINHPLAEITVWDVGMQQRVCTIPLGDSEANCLAISPDANYIACRFSASNDIQIWQITDIDKAQWLKALTAGPAKSREFAWAPDAQSLAMIDENGHLSVWDIRSGELVFRLSDDHPDITAMAWSPQDAHLAVSFLSDHQTIPVEIELWDVNNKSVLKSIHIKAFSPTGHPITQLTWSSNGQSLAYLAKGNTGLWDKEASSTRTLDITGATELTWFNNSDILAIGDSHGSLYCLEKNSDRITQSWISAWCGPAQAAEFSLQGDRLAVLSANSMVSLWETRTWKTLGGWQVEGVNLEDHSGPCVLAWSASGNEVGVGTVDGKSFAVLDSHSLRQVRSNERIQRVKEELDLETKGAERLSSTIRSLDASFIAMWDINGTIQIREQNESDVHCTLSITDTELLSISWSPENMYILATTADGTVRVWDAANDFRSHALLMPWWGMPDAGIAFTDGGDFRGSPKIFEHLRYVAQTEHGQKTWRAEEFRDEHGWANEPWQVGLFEPGAETVKRMYVKASAEDSLRGDGLSWDTAFSDLQDALSSASEGTEIWVAAGIYKPDRGSGDRNASFHLKSGVLLYGGFAGHETSIHQRSKENKSTILSGDLYGNDRENNNEIINNEENSYHVVVVEDTNPQVPPALLDGFVIAGGNANEPRPNTEGLWLGHWGGGALIQSRNLTIQNCVFRYNSAMRNGGGLGLWDGTITIENCQFISNYSEHSGGGASLSGEDSVLRHCLFKKNQAEHCGGGIYEGSDGCLIEDCDFLENMASEGGAVNCYMKKSFINCCFYRNQANGSGGGAGGGLLTVSPLELRSCLFISNTTNGNGGAIFGGQQTISVENTGFVNNSARNTGGAIDSLDGDLKVVNCSILYNKVTRQEDPGAGGIDHHFYDEKADPNRDATLNLANTILWGNLNHGGYSKESQLSAINVSASHCCIQGWMNRPEERGNMAETPLFRNINGLDKVLGTLDDDFRLREESPCIDSGDHALLSLDAYDLDHDHDVNEPLPVDLHDSIRVVGKGVDIGACENSQAP